jgi:hypothetical protein
MTRAGSPATAIAIITRCLSPPDSSCGKADIRAAGSGMPTAPNSLSASAALPAASATWRPTRMVGFNDVIGSWNTAPMWTRRTSRRTDWGLLTMSLPRTVTSPLTRAFASSNPRTDRPSTLLPEPDSPTSPRISPGRTSRLTPRKAWMSRPPLRNVTCRSSTRATRAASTAVTSPRVAVMAPVPSARYWPPSCAAKYLSIDKQ